MGFTNEKVTEYISSYYRPLNDELRRSREMNEERNVPLILRETEMFLSLTLDILRPSHILEIGTAYGYSSLFFAAKLPEARITTIERSEHMIAEAEKAFSSSTYGERITMLTGDADAVLDDMIAGRAGEDVAGPYDFIFIDAGKSHYREFFERAEKLAAPGAVTVCDNILMHGWTVDRSYQGAKRHRTNVKYMRQFIDYINERDDLTVSLLSSGDGLAVIRFND